jgi:hypothetical protein
MIFFQNVENFKNCILVLIVKLTLLRVVIHHVDASSSSMSIILLLQRC